MQTWYRGDVIFGTGKAHGARRRNVGPSRVFLVCLLCALGLGGCGKKTPVPAPAPPAPPATTNVSVAISDGSDQLVQTPEGVFVLNQPASFNLFFSNPAPAIVLFYSRTSVPCVMMSALLSRTATNYLARVRFGRVDLSDTNSAVLEAQCAVRAVPTLIFVRDGREQHRLVGKTARDRLDFMIERKLLKP